MGKNSKIFKYKFDLDSLEDDDMFHSWQHCMHDYHGKGTNDMWFTSWSERLSDDFKKFMNTMVGKGNWMYRNQGKPYMCFKTEPHYALFLLRMKE